jgi:hypothetical protein
MAMAVSVYECGICFDIVFVTMICEICSDEMGDYLETVERNSPIVCLRHCKHGDIW